MCTAYKQRSGLFKHGFKTCTWNLWLDPLKTSQMWLEWGSSHIQSLWVRIHGVHFPLFLVSTMCVCARMSRNRTLSLFHFLCACCYLNSNRALLSPSNMNLWRTSCITRHSYVYRFGSLHKSRSEQMEGVALASWLRPQNDQCCSLFVCPKGAAELHGGAKFISFLPCWHIYN